jgi:hypothetical protein
MYTPPESLNLSYSDFKDKVIQGKISEITIKGDKITGSFKGPVRQGFGREGSAPPLKNALPESIRA